MVTFLTFIKICKQLIVMRNVVEKKKLMKFDDNLHTWTFSSHNKEKQFCKQHEINLCMTTLIHDFFLI